MVMLNLKYPVKTSLMIHAWLFHLVFDQKVYGQIYSIDPLRQPTKACETFLPVLQVRKKLPIRSTYDAIQFKNYNVNFK